MPKISFEGGDTRSYLEDRKTFYSTLLPAVWTVLSLDETSCGTGFCISEDGLIMTCLHCVEDEDVMEFQLINLDYSGTKTYMPARVVKKCDNHDIAILKACPKKKERSFDFVTFAEDGEEICLGDEVHLIGSCDEFHLSFMSGRVAYPCKFDHDHMHKTQDLQKPFQHRARIDSRVEPFRVLGNLYNNSVPEVHPDILYDLHPQSPHIQVSHFISPDGCSGGPLFNNRGQVIGMHAIGGAHQSLSIHYIALKWFKDQLETGVIERGSSNRGKDEGSSQGKDEGSSQRKMILRECDVSFENVELKPHQCESLYEEMKKIMWIVKISCRFKRDKTPLVRYCTGFCVHSDGYIITSAFQLSGGTTFSIRTLDDPDTIYFDAKWVNKVDGIGIALLKIDRLSCNYGKLADVVDVPVGTNVFGIAHPGHKHFGSYVYTFLFGRIVSGVIGRDEVMVHEDELMMHVNSLASDIQFRHIYGFSSLFDDRDVMQSLGAPVFNSRGHIIGMVGVSTNGFDYAFLSSHIKNIINTFNPCEPKCSSKSSTSGGSKKVPPKRKKMV